MEVYAASGGKSRIDLCEVSGLRNWKNGIPAAQELKPRTLVELYGRERLLVEQHRGILGYGSDCIRIGTTFGVLEVTGEGMRLCCMSPSQIVIRGRIAAVRVEGGS